MFTDLAKIMRRGISWFIKIPNLRSIFLGTIEDYKEQNTPDN